MSWSLGLRRSPQMRVRLGKFLKMSGKFQPIFGYYQSGRSSGPGWSLGPSRCETPSGDGCCITSKSNSHRWRRLRIGNRGRNPRQVVVCPDAEIIRELASLAALEAALVDQLQAVVRKRARLLATARFHDVIGGGGEVRKTA
jgi:hypothetical protein